MAFKPIWALFREEWHYLRSSLRRQMPESRAGGAHNAGKEHVRALLAGQLKQHWRMVALVLAGLVIVSAAELALPIAMKFLVDSVLLPKNFELLIPTLIMLALISAVSSGCGSLQSFVSGRLQHRINLGLKAQLTQHLLKLPSCFFDHVSSGYLASRVFEDVRSMTVFFGAPMQNFISSLMMVIGALVVLFCFDWRLGLGTALVMPVFFFTTKIFGRKQYTLAANYSEEVSAAYGSLQQTLTNIKLVKSASGEEEVYDKLSQRYSDIYNLNMEITALGTIFQRVMQFLPNLCRFFVLIFSCYQVIYGDWQVGSLIAVNSLVVKVLTPTRLLATTLVQMTTAQASLARLSSLLQLVPEDNLETGVKVEKMKGKIEFRDVSFEYVPGHKVLEHVSFKVNPGEMVAIVGPSGAGKSTIAALLMHLYQIADGAVMVDNRDINCYNLPYYRKRFSYLGTDMKLFNASLAANVSYGNSDVTCEEMTEILNDLGLQELTAKGLDMMVEEEARNLSAGQQLRVALARELLRRGDIVVLDEPTAALDRRHEEMAAKVIRERAAGRSVIIITHREHLARIADRVLLVQNHTIAGEGGYDELIARFGNVCSNTGS